MSPSSPAAGQEGVGDSLLASHSFPSIPTASIVDSTRGSVQLDGGPGASSSSSSAGGCTCLQLHPQEDANLPQFHPNIYIPAALLDYPEELTKYGGGGKNMVLRSCNLFCTKLQVCSRLVSRLLSLLHQDPA